MLEENLEPTQIREELNSVQLGGKIAENENKTISNLLDGLGGAKDNSPKLGQASDIFLWYPNIIGYIRIILALIAFMRYYQPVIFFWCYLTSFLLDAADGYVARLYNQCSRFGSILDMVTDRFATAILVMILSYLYYDYRHTCMILIVLDISSHWFRVVASLLTGRGHKSIKASNSIFIRILHNYYHSRLVLSVVCLGNELFYIFAYMNYYAPAWKIFEGSHPIFFYLMILCFPVFLYKQILSLIQLQYSAVEIVEWELENDHNNPLI